jgi:hypothetical protein
MGSKKTKVGITKTFANWWMKSPSSRYLVWIILIGTIVGPLLFPIGLPIGVTEFTRAYYDYIEAAPTGGTAILSFDFASGAEALRIISIDTMKHLASKQIKIIGMGVYEPIINPVAQAAFGEVDWEGAGFEYGTDYVFIGWIPGEETAIAALYSDFRGQIQYDFYGTPTSQLPLIQSVADHNDIDLVICFIDYPQISRVWTRQWPSEPDRPLLGTFGTIYYPLIVKGLISGMKGAAEYEYLTGKPGAAISGTDILTIAMGYHLVIIAVANLAFWLRREERARRALGIGRGLQEQ